MHNAITGGRGGTLYCAKVWAMTREVGCRNRVSV